MEENRRTSKRVLAIVLIAVGVISFVLGILGLMGGGGIDPYEARDGVVLVYAQVSDTQGNSEAGIGTGWAIGTPGQPVQYIVTNGHVVEKAYTYPRLDSSISGLVQVYFSAAENDFVQAKVVYFSGSTEKDLAILQLPSATDKRTALKIRASDTVDVGETAYALGYPGNSSNVQDFVTYDKNDITLTKGIVSKRTTTNGSTYEAFQMDVSIASGNSGGPLVDEQGNVIGISVATAYDVVTGQLSDVHYAIVADELIKILDSERISYTMANVGMYWAQSWMGFVFLPIGIILLALGVVFLAQAQKGAKPAVAGAGKAGPRVRADKGSGPMDKRATLRGVTGKYTGQSFDLLKGKVVLGRDPATCNIVFDKNAPGISGRHCQVAYDPNEDCFLITDLGSSYGTFLGNGKKLTANVAERLSTGDTFYLCDNGNRFVVTKE